MSYNYEVEKHKIFTEQGQREFLKVRDRAKKLLAEAGAFMMFSALKDVSGDSWQMMAYVDHLIELGEIREITPANVAGQHRVFVSAGEHRNTPAEAGRACTCISFGATTHPGVVMGDCPLHGAPRLGG